MVFLAEKKYAHSCQAMPATSLTKIVVCVVTIISTLGLATSTSFPLTNAGTRFVTGDYSSHTKQELTLYITTPKNRNVSFSISGAASQSGSVNSSGVFTVFLDEIESGVLISSDDGVSQLIVSALKTINNNLAGDTFTVYPVQEYSSYTYFAVSLEREDEIHRGFVHLIGTKDGTNVTITPTVSVDSLVDSYGCFGMAGQDCKLTLNRLQSLVIRTTSDLTGTKIVSSAPLSVISGHECALVPANYSTHCKSLVEQIPPTVTWGKNFLVAPLVGHNSPEWYKIISSSENTNVIIFCSSSDSIYTIKTHQLRYEGNSHFFEAINGRRCSIVSNKPILVMQFAANDAVDTEADTFMVLVPPVKQYLSSVFLSLSLPKPSATIHSMTVMLTIPAIHCPNSQCSILVDDDITIDVSNKSQPILCSENEVCGYVVNYNLTTGSHILRLSETGGYIGVISYLSTYEPFVYEVGTTGGLGLNHIAVERPEVIVGYDGVLLAGERLVLVCNVSFRDGLGNGIKIIPRWYRGGEHFKTGTPVETHIYKTGPYIANHTFDPLSISDSDEYRCEVDISSEHVGVLTTASASMTITVVGFRYIQMRLIGVPKCSEWLSESEDRVDALLEEVASIISKDCNCDYSSSYLTQPTLQCAPDQDSSTTLLLQTRVQLGGDTPAPIDYGRVVEILEAAEGDPIRFRTILLKVGSASKDCGISIDSFQISPDCFPESPPSTPGTEGVASNIESNHIILVVVVVVCVVIVVGLIIVVIVVVARSRRQPLPDVGLRPKSIHLHQRLPHGGDSVTSFSAHSGSPDGPNVYIEKEPLSSPTSKSITFSLPQTGNGTMRNGHHHCHQHSSSTLSTTTTADCNEHESNYRTMKTNLSEMELLPTITHL